MEDLGVKYISSFDDFLKTCDVVGAPPFESWGLPANTPRARGPVVSTISMHTAKAATNLVGVAQKSII